MSEENFRQLDMGMLLQQRLANKMTSASSPSTNSFDPHKLFLNKKREEVTGEIDPSTIIKWKEEEVKVLEDYCKKMGIVGFSCGRMSPIAALAMLKNRLGDVSPTNTENSNTSQKQIICG